MTDIVITNARVHNLRGIDVTIPRNSLTVITGLSGSGKSSLAFDTLYAEGQRRYVESLSAYARQFLDRLGKPEVDRIEGLSPAISIEQHTTAGNPRSVVATVTEIHDYLRVLYGSAAVPHCPSCGKEVRRQSAEQIVESIAALVPEGGREKAVLYAPVVRGRKGAHAETLDAVKRNGFARVRIDGETHPVDELPSLDRKKNHTIDIVVDRLVLPCDRTRLTDSVELALREGKGILTLALAGSGDERVFSELNACPDCGISFDELKARSFSFNSPFGACPGCAGLGRIYYFDEDLVVPDKSLPLAEAIHPWRRMGQMSILYHKELLAQIAAQFRVSLDTPYERLPAAFRRGLMHGFKEDLVLPWRRNNKPFEGVLASLQRRMEEAEDDESRARFDAYRNDRVCPDCGGARLRPESRAATVAGRTIVDVMAQPVSASLPFFEDMAAHGADGVAASRLEGLRDVLSEIVRRLRFLKDVGLDYLTLDRASSTLSGGEMQRIRLATQIGSGLTGVLYVLDEPTIGLHPRDNARLIETLKRLRDRGNTVVVVEHDEEMMRAADYIVDLGPGAGREGGRVMYQGAFEGLRQAASLTGDYLSGRRRVAPPPSGRPFRPESFLVVHGACANNLKNVTARFPVGAFTVVTGVSGSGKSTLVEETLKRALMQRFYRAKAVPGRHRKVTGWEAFDKIVEIDQSPIGRTPRSNPATYVGFFSEIRELFAQTEAAKARGYTAGRFSFNVKGGRCEVCKGDGLQKLEMSFLPDVYVPCEQCGGRRFNAETLEILYGGKNIADVLDMTVAEACAFFSKIPALRRRLETLCDVGLGYVALGQSATTLSGGEAQRIKLATELSRRSTGRTLYLLDEPTTGLHFDDVAKLLRLLMRLRDQGNTVVVIEHNLDVMRGADWIVDLGPGGGANGGELVCEGPVETVRACARSATGRVL
jgi:excinuclease ABC subunit A